LIQARIERIGLAHFLAKARVPGYVSPSYSCASGDKTAEYLLFYYEEEAERRVW
jgi:hypothetical protein